ncbi:MAG: LPS export ABC transporter periplasmic protein LptC [Limnochordia bacterium]|jgi:LPS export ABC transporter protein LptC|nr:LPS export ABC transporter periplasmic protein LptC [Bacillota bacterium]NLL07552.1 LPS export ABC transporter periplasmic protein LptC [Bacillota bacterium]HBG09623.1 LPS export ABC transporter periplasmic protein LptC [Bacillota bacterium]
MNLSTKAKRLIAAGVVLVGVILFITFRYLATPAPPAVSVPPSVQLVESRLVGRKEGQRQWEIVSRMVLQEGDVVTLSELEEMIVFQDGEPYLSIDTPRAQWQRKQEILHLHGPVLVEGKEGFQLESDFLEWQGRTNMLSSPGPVRIIWRGMEITASEMAMDTEEGVVHLKRDVEIRDEGLVWKLEEVVYNLDAESMDFYGNVLMEEEAGSD